CDFFSVAAAGWDIDATLEAVLAEARVRAPRNPRMVFIGGGTPSLLSHAQLEDFLNGLEACTSFRSSAVETTIEANPESVDRDKVLVMLDGGVNRLSIGFQSLEPKTLQLFGRVHAVEDSFRAYEAARSAGMKNINLDMIYASPEHRARDWEQALQTVLDLEPEHLSAYNLAFEEETVFSRWLKSGKLKALPEDVELEMFGITRRITSERGLNAYEISNYARDGKTCLHNENYWANGSYVGIGPSAVSYVNGVRFGSPRDINDYGKRIQECGAACTWSEKLSPLARLGETWWLGLRRSSGVTPAVARRDTGYEVPDDPMLQIARSLVSHGLLREDGETFYLTSKGLPLADRVASEFLVTQDEPDSATLVPPTQG
ncbi:MAG: oxygen-independent coproporphyrinogen-3 oxidase, partial [Candidatus Paceibacteria bacterium]